MPGSFIGVGRFGPLTIVALAELEHAVVGPEVHSKKTGFPENRAPAIDWATELWTV